MSEVLKPWESYYVIVGSSAGALTGLQFVVLTLITESGVARSGETLSAFGTPNVVHFCAALLVSALFSAPWHGLGAPGVAVAVCGICGVVYSVSVLRRALRQRDYKPVLEDWVWHAALPMLAYAALVSAGVGLVRGSSAMLYVVAGAALLLVFIGIHNAWDTVTYSMTLAHRDRRTPPVAPSAPARAVPTSGPAAPVASPAATTSEPP